PCHVQRGTERGEYARIPDFTACIICGREQKKLVKGRCHRCRSYLRANGQDRPLSGVGPPRGERHSQAKLTAAQVRAIRFDPRPQTEIAAAYGVSQSTISLIQLLKTWTHID